jgi:peptidoglycan biosynthesis protein MviN/MurJ (putative lipid II flippase)
MVVVRHVDLVLLALALPVFLGAGLPLLAYGLVAGAWLTQRGLQHVLADRARATDDPRKMAGLAVGSMMARSIIVAVAIIVAGTTEREAGVAAGLLVIVLFTVYFVMSLILGPLEAPRRPAS